MIMTMIENFKRIISSDENLNRLNSAKNSKFKQKANQKIKACAF
jgi:hypothetical protein